MFSLDLKDTASVSLSLGLALGVIVVLIKFFLDRKQHPGAYYAVLAYDLLKVTAVGLVLTLSVNLYTLNVSFDSTLSQLEAAMADLARLTAEATDQKATIASQSAQIEDLTRQLQAARDRADQLSAAAVPEVQRRFLTDVMAACEGDTLNYGRAAQVLESSVNTLCH